MKDKVCFITGVGRGLGRELARSLSDRGATVWGSTRTGTADEELGLAGCVPIELGDPASIARGMASLGRSVDHLDLVINNAGIDTRALGASDDERGPLDIDPTDLVGVMAINVAAPLAVTQHALNLLGQAPRGAIVVNISSQLGSLALASTMGRDVAYDASKAALNMVTIKTARQLADDKIAVVAVHPGWVATDMGGPNAQLTPTDSANAIVDLVEGLEPSDSGRFIRWDGVDHPW